jgi:hypothetical protein
MAPKQQMADDDPYASSGLFSQSNNWRTNNKRNYGGMFGGDAGEDEGLFN